MYLGPTPRKDWSVLLSRCTAPTYQVLSSIWRASVEGRREGQKVEVLVNDPPRAGVLRTVVVDGIVRGAAGQARLCVHPPNGLPRRAVEVGGRIAVAEAAPEPRCRLLPGGQHHRHRQVGSGRKRLQEVVAIAPQTRNRLVPGELQR